MVRRAGGWQRAGVRFGRRSLFVVWLARRRLARRLGPSALVGVGIAAGAVVLAAVSAGGLLAQVRHLEQEVVRIPEAERAVKAVWFGVPRRAAWAELDGQARLALASLQLGDPLATLRYRQTKIGGDLVDLAAADQLSRWVDVSSGRLPRNCRPERCEIVQVGGSGRIPSVPGLRIVKVGDGTVTSGVPFGELVSREGEASVVGTALRHHTAESPPFLLAEGVEELARVEPLASIFRSYGWVIPLAPGDVRPWEVDELSAAVTGARSDLEASTDLFEVTAPAAELEAARTRAETGARRLLLVGGTAAALLLAFAVLAASALRRDSDAVSRRLTWFGARPWQLAALPAAESGAVAFAAVLVGWAAGGAIVALAARGSGTGAGRILRESVFSSAGLMTALLLALAAWMAVFAFLRARPLKIGGAAATPLDVAALGAIAVVAFALARGALDARALASQGSTGGLLLVLPGLVAFVAAVAAARAAGPTFRLAERVARPGPVSARLVALALARRPGRAAVAGSFLAVSFGLALFAEAYRSTLERGQGDQAAFAVPADFVVREDLRNLVPVTQVAPIGMEVLRRSGDIARLEGSRGVTLLGLSSAFLPGIDGWRGDFSRQSLNELASRIEPTDSAALRAVPLPGEARTLEIQVSLTGDDVTLAANIETPRGDFVTVPLGQTRGSRPVELRGRLPDHARGGRLVALTFGIARQVYHDRGEGEPVREPTATANLTLGPLRAERSRIPLDYARWVAGNGAHLVAGSEDGARLTLILTNEFPGRFRLPQPTDARPIPAIVSPRLAAAAGAGGILPVRLTGDQLRVRVVGVAERFPSAEDDFVVADRDLVATALNADRPGAAVTNERWLDVPEGRLPVVEARLGRPPFDVLDVRAQAAVLADLRTDPLARGTLLTLVGAAVVALALALVGLLLVVVTDVRDDAAELFDLEAQGAAPGMLRSHLRMRTAAVAAFGLLGGVVTGGVLSAVVADFVTLTAGAGTEEPPLVLHLDWPVLLAAGAGYALVAGLLVAFTTRRAFRAQEAGRLQETTA